MKANTREQEFVSDLRRRAAVRALPFRDDFIADPNMAPETGRLVQELQMHHIELELQNEDLERARAEVEEGLARYTDLYDFAPVGYLTLNRGGVIEQTNLAGAKLFGMERSRSLSLLVGMRLSFVISAECRRDFAAFLEKTFESPTKEACEVVVHAGQAVRTVELVAMAFEDGQRCRVIVNDISQRRRAEEMLSVHLRLQEHAVEHSRKELLQMAVDEIARMTGGSSGSCYSLAADGRGFVREIGSTQRPGQFVEIEDVSQRYSIDDTGIGKDGELVAPIYRNGKTVALLVIANKSTAFTDDDLKSARYLADVAWEIAERKKAEEERKRAEEERKKAEEERKAAQLNLLLADAQKMEAIATLAGGIAHDFNNILSGIMCSLSWLDLEEVERAKQHECIKDMMTLVTRGSDVTKQLLGFSSHGRYEVRPLNLARVAAKTSAMFGRMHKEIAIETDFAPDLLTVLMDRAQIEQALLNLLVNAAQAMPDGGRLSLCGENADLASTDLVPPGVAPGRFVRLVVKDTGVGMDAATQGRIFEPFFTTKGPGQGTGLGLASVYGVVKSHGGFVTVASALGKGTTFTIHLPAVDHAPAEEKTPAVAIVRGSGTILIVDDEPAILVALAHLLRKVGYVALTASSGLEALEIVRQLGESISLVILDMVMPGMTGSQTFDAIRQVAPDINVLLASGYSKDEQIQDMMARGCAGFLQKPFNIVALSEKLSAIQQSLESPDADLGSPAAR